MPTFVFDETFPGFKNRKGADPQVIGEELEKIAETHGGELKPGDVVDTARAPRHKLHRYFEWDDKVAAEEHRKDQARSMIRSIKIVREDDDPLDEPPPAFLSVSSGGRAYRTLSTVLGSVELRRAVVRQAAADLTHWQRRYRQLREVCDMIEPARRRLDELASDDDRRPAA